MKFQVAVLLSLSSILSMTTTTEAFSPMTGLSSRGAVGQKRSSSLRRMSSSSSTDEVAKLRQAAAQAREDAARLAKVRIVFCT